MFPSELKILKKGIIGLVSMYHLFAGGSFIPGKKSFLAHKQKLHGYQQSEKEFDLSMGFDGSFKSQKRQKLLLTKICKELYVKNNLTKVTDTKKLLIPKIVHLIWLGPKTPPAVFTECLKSIATHLPDWQVKIWTDTDIPSLNLINQQFFDEESNYGAKSDILRYELLYKFGGLYLDVDMVLVKSLTILHQSYEFYAGLQPLSFENIVGNALIGSVPGHPILEKCIENIKIYRTEESILSRTGPGLFEKAFSEVVEQATLDRIIVLPASYFYPSTRKVEMRESPQSLVKPETYALHYWAGSWDIDQKPS